ncbi:hypothetical protein Pla52n_14360 [Stieleria varia]|uniref:Uncharacterized protein n=1 Tax=Stieleria varia TaxID=2528005 RepID=A0A5C6B2C5_9BACT|nr:hypothetical protein Pla52n_14360 [Stieleria varia]
MGVKNASKAEIVESPSIDDHDGLFAGWQSPATFDICAVAAGVFDP